MNEINDYFNDLGRTQNTLGNKFSIIKFQTFTFFQKIWFRFIRNEIMGQHRAKKLLSNCPC